MAATADDPSTFCPGERCPPISRRALHGRNRARLRAALLEAQGKKNGEIAATKPTTAARPGAVLLLAGPPASLYETDMDRLFLPDAFFYHQFGLDGVEGAVGLLDLGTGAATLFVLRPPPAAAVWTGPPLPLPALAAAAGVDAAAYTEDLGKALTALGDAPIHILDGVNSDSGRRTALTAAAEAMVTEAVSSAATSSPPPPLERRLLHPTLSALRAIKTPEEVAALRHAARASAAAHLAVLRAGPWAGRREFEVEALFRCVVLTKGGCRNVAYPCIVGAGPRAAILHYGHAGAPNDGLIGPKDLVLADCGGRYGHWCGDVTQTFPASGRFSPDARALYDAVYAAFTAVKAAAKPGVAWPDLHALAEKQIISGLQAGGWIAPGDPAAAVAAGVGALFMPHGLGHLLGLDTHDVGGYGPGLPPRPTRAGADRLRTARLLEPGLVITVEPGAYFIESLLGPVLDADPAVDPRAAWLVADRVRAALDAGLGGVRLEDDCLITPDGLEVLSAGLPRRAEDVERVMAGGEWPDIL
jgi:Xaa-Pro dipeptidase